MKASVLAIVLLTACAAQRAVPADGPLAGATGAAGAPGRDGAPGVAGQAGASGRDGNGYIDGSRLKAVYWAGVDGSKLFDHMQDTKYDAACYMTTVGTETRCAFGLSAGVFSYSDAGCSMPVVMGAAPSGFTDFNGKFYTPTPSAATQAWSLLGLSCIGPSAVSGEVHGVSEVPFSDFVLMNKVSQ